MPLKIFLASARRALLLIAVVLLGGCRAAPREATVAPAQTAEHYRHFDDADALSAYLRHGSEAGPLVSAHRGGPMPGYPENALATFENALGYAPVLLEVDVRLTRDSVLVLMHDETLDRTTTGRGRVDTHTLAELQALHLVDETGAVTAFRIPTLVETLSWAARRAVLTLDVKPEVPPEQVVEAVGRAGVEGQIVYIVYTFEDLLHVHRLAPDLIISAGAETMEEVRQIFESDIDPSRLIAFTGVGEVKPEVIAALHTRDIRAMLGTFGALDVRATEEGPAVFEALFAQGLDVIATDVVPLAARAAEAVAAH